MNQYGEFERMRGTVEDLPFKKQLPRRQTTDKPILKYDTSITKPIQLFNQGDATSRYEGQARTGTVAGPTANAAAQNSSVARAPTHKQVRRGSGGSGTKGVDNPYSRPVSAQDVIEDVLQNHRHGWMAHHGGVHPPSLSSKPSMLTNHSELDSNARVAALQHNSFLRPQSGLAREVAPPKVSNKKVPRTGSGFGDGPDVGSQYAPEESQGYNYKATAKSHITTEQSAKAALQQAFALASTTSATASHSTLNGLPPRPKNMQNRENRPNAYDATCGYQGTSSLVRNPNYTPSRPYTDINEPLANGANSVNIYSNSTVTSEQSMFSHKQPLMNYPAAKNGNAHNKSHIPASFKSAKSSLESPKGPLAKLVPNGRVEPIPRSPTGPPTGPPMGPPMGPPTGLPTGLAPMAGVEESGLPLHNLTASSLLNTKMGMLRKMPVTNTLTGTLYYKKSFREASKQVEKKQKALLLEQRPSGDGAPSKQIPQVAEEKSLKATEEADEEDDDSLSTPSGERLPGDGEASIDEFDDDEDDGIDDLYNDNEDQDDEDESDDYTISSSMSQASTSTINLRSASSRPSTTQSNRVGTAGDEYARSFIRPLTSSGETAVQPALRRSLFQAIPPTINFIIEGEKVEQLPWEIRKFLKWRMSPITPNIVKAALGRSNFRITKKNHDWLGCFGKHMKANAFKSLRDYQKLNHFPGSFQLGRKDRLWRNLSKLQLSFGKKEFGFFPQTYVLPQDIKQLKRNWEDSGSRQKWIIKPPASARGIGIKVIHKWNQIPRKRPIIVQKYLAKPLLIDGSKFDMRVYVYVSSYDPLRAYVYEDGLARFASCKYSSSMKALNNKFMHLTNYSINKRNADYQSNTDDTVCQGHKWSLKALWNYLKRQGVNTQAVWDNIKDIVVKTLISSETPINSMVKSNVRSRYIVHELFGFDILLDEQLRPWILEVNISPSLHSNSQLDINVKGQMIRDMLNIAGFRVPDRNDVQHSAPHASSSSQDLGARAPSSDYCMDKRLFTNSVAPDERAKHAYFCHKHQDEQVLQGILDTLTPDDVRILTESIDEDSRKGGFIRVFPTPSTKKYLRFFEQPRYYNLLLDQWVTRYNRMEQRGIGLLQSFCEEGLHVENPTDKARHQWCPPNSTAMLSARDKVATSPTKKESFHGPPTKKESFHGPPTKKESFHGPPNKGPVLAPLPKVRNGTSVPQSKATISQATGSSSFSTLNSSPPLSRTAQPLDSSR